MEAEDTMVDASTLNESNADQNIKTERNEVSVTMVVPASTTGSGIAIHGGKGDRGSRGCEGKGRGGGVVAETV